MNTELLLKVKDAILANPKQFDMRSYFSDVSDANCGTTACIAGWAVAVTANAALDDVRYNYGFCEDVESDASAALGLDFAQSEKLFHHGYWPADLCSRYVRADDPKERATIAAERIDRFIASNGAE